MALKKPTNDNVNTTPAFEDADLGAAVVQEETPAQTEAQASVAATTAIAKAATSAVTTNTGEEVKRFQQEFDEMQNAANFDYGNYTVFKAIDGEIRETGQNKTLSLGRWADVRLMGWGFSWQVGPGSDNQKAKDFVGYSEDGETISSIIGEDLRHFVGKPINEYLTYLRDTEGYDKAECKKYLHTACAVLNSESGKHEPGTIIQITLSPSSIPAFNAYQEKLKTTARAVKMGLPGFALPSDPFTFRLATESASRGSNRWTKLKIEAITG